MLNRLREKNSKKFSLERNFGGQRVSWDGIETEGGFFGIRGHTDQSRRSQIGLEQKNGKSGFSILVTAGLNLGAFKRSKEMSRDSLDNLSDVLGLAKMRKVDFCIFAGDTFSSPFPQNNITATAINVLRKKVCYKPGSKEAQKHTKIEFSCLSEKKLNFEKQAVLGIKMPIFAIAGAHDTEPGSENHPVDLLEISNLVNFEKPILTQKHPKVIKIQPVLMRKGTTELAIYFLSYLREVELSKLLGQNLIKFEQKGENPVRILVLSAKRSMMRHTTRVYPKERLHWQDFPENSFECIFWANDDFWQNNDENQQDRGLIGSWDHSLHPNSSQNAPKVPKIECVTNSLKIINIPSLSLRNLNRAYLEVGSTSLVQIEGRKVTLRTCLMDNMRPIFKLDFGINLADQCTMLPVTARVKAKLDEYYQDSSKNCLKRRLGKLVKLRPILSVLLKPEFREGGDVKVEGSCASLSQNLIKKPQKLTKFGYETFLEKGVKQRWKLLLKQAEETIGVLVANEGRVFKIDYSHLGIDSTFRHHSRPLKRGIRSKKQLEDLLGESKGPKTLFDEFSQLVEKMVQKKVKANKEMEKSRSNSLGDLLGLSQENSRDLTRKILKKVEKEEDPFVDQFKDNFLAKEPSGMCLESREFPEHQNIDQILSSLHKGEYSISRLDLAAERIEEQIRSLESKERAEFELRKLLTPCLKEDQKLAKKEDLKIEGEEGVKNEENCTTRSSDGDKNQARTLRSLKIENEQTTQNIGQITPPKLLNLFQDVPEIIEKPQGRSKQPQNPRNPENVEIKVENEKVEEISFSNLTMELDNLLYQHCPHLAQPNPQQAPEINIKNSHISSQNTVKRPKILTKELQTSLGKRTPVDMIPKMLEELRRNSDLDLMNTPTRKASYASPNIKTVKRNFRALRKSIKPKKLGFGNRIHLESVSDLTDDIEEVESVGLVKLSPLKRLKVSKEQETVRKRVWVRGKQSRGKVGSKEGKRARGGVGDVGYQEEVRLKNLRRLGLVSRGKGHQESEKD